jgi:hypothetical protein
MHYRFGRYLGTLFTIVASLCAMAQEPPAGPSLPELRRDSVLVYRIQNLDYKADFVVRIAEFSPDRYLEWEDETSQGTVFMPVRDIESAKGFINSNLFKSGSDTRGNNATTLWLSRQIFRDLKDKRKTKCMINGTSGVFKYIGDDALEVEVNRKSMALKVIKVMDDRQEERWFLDLEDNPLMVCHKFRKFSQTLESVTTDRANTLRWIKGRKLNNPPH